MLTHKHTHLHFIKRNHCDELGYRYHNGNAYIIDVSQSVEHDHPHALEFLRKDCSNVNGGKISECDESEMTMSQRFLWETLWRPFLSTDLVTCSFYPEFFVKRGVAVMTVRELFDFITDPSITQQNINQYLEKVRICLQL